MMKTKNKKILNILKTNKKELFLFFTLLLSLSDPYLAAWNLLSKSDNSLSAFVLYNRVRLISLPKLDEIDENFLWSTEFKPPATRFSIKEPRLNGLNPDGGDLNRRSKGLDNFEKREFSLLPLSITFGFIPKSLAGREGSSSSVRKTLMKDNHEKISIISSYTTVFLRELIMNDNPECHNIYRFVK